MIFTWLRSARHDRLSHFARHLAARGVVSPPEPASCEDAEAGFDDYEPVTVEGRPLSEMIIEDRR